MWVTVLLNLTKHLNIKITNPTLSAAIQNKARQIIKQTKAIRNSLSITTTGNILYIAPLMQSS